MKTNINIKGTLKKISEYVKKECLSNNELLDNEPWINDINFAIAEGRDYVEISSNYSSTGNPIIIEIIKNK